MSCSCLRCTKERVGADPQPAWPIDPRLHRMFLCAICGNKRCPHSDDHRNPCTGSNAPGQTGSRYAATPQTPKEASL